MRETHEDERQSQMNFRAADNRATTTHRISEPEHLYVLPRGRIQRIIKKRYSRAQEVSLKLDREMMSRRA